jgi:AcrR family transcriptional regulator
VAVIPLTRQRRRELTRDALIEAAAELFAHRGVHAASLDDIAAAAGFTKGAIYSNFGSKEDLLLAVVEERGDQMLAMMWHAHQSSETYQAQDPAQAADLWRDIVARDQDLQLLRLELRLFAMREPSLRPKLAQVQRRQHRKASEFLRREAASAGYELRWPAEDVAAILIALTEGLLLNAAIDPCLQAAQVNQFQQLLALLKTM